MVFFAKSKKSVQCPCHPNNRWARKAKHFTTDGIQYTKTHTICIDCYRQYKTVYMTHPNGALEYRTYERAAVHRRIVGRRQNVVNFPNLGSAHLFAGAINNTFVMIHEEVEGFMAHQLFVRWLQRVSN